MDSQRAPKGQQSVQNDYGNPNMTKLSAILQVQKSKGQTMQNINCKSAEG